MTRELRLRKVRSVIAAGPHDTAGWPDEVLILVCGTSHSIPALSAVSSSSSASEHDGPHISRRTTRKRRSRNAKGLQRRLWRRRQSSCKLIVPLVSVRIRCSLPPRTVHDLERHGRAPQAQAGPPRRPFQKALHRTWIHTLAPLGDLAPVGLRPSARRSRGVSTPFRLVATAIADDATCGT